MDALKIKEGTRVESVNKYLTYFPAGATGTIVHYASELFPTDPITLKDHSGDYWVKVDAPVNGLEFACASPDMLKILEY